MSEEKKTALETNSSKVESTKILLEKIKLPNNFNSTAPVVKKQLHVHVGRPNKQDFFKICPDESYRTRIAMLEVSEDRSKYLVSPDLITSVPNEIYFSEIYLGANKNGDYFIFDLKLPGENRQVNSWTTSKFLAIDEAKRSWIRMSSNMASKSYEIYIATNDQTEVTWPTQPFEYFLNLAFKDNFIDSIDHPVLKKLRGE